MAGMAGEQVEGSEEAAALREGEEALVQHLETSRRRELEEVAGRGRGVWRAVTIQGHELLQVELTSSGAADEEALCWYLGWSAAPDQFMLICNCTCRSRTCCSPRRCPSPSPSSRASTSS